MYSKSTGKNKELSYISLAMKGLHVYGTIVYQYFLRSYIGCAIDGAIKNKNQDIVKLLLDSGSDLSYDDLKKAVEAGYLDLVDYLLKKCKEKDEKNKLGSVPASLVKTAILNKHHKVAKLLINSGADLNSAVGGDALCAAISSGDPAMVKLG